MKTANYTLVSLGGALSALLLLPSFTQAAPLVSIGDNVDVFFNGSSSMRWMSNVFRDEDDEEEDLVWTISPGFEMNVGRGLSNADLSVITRYDILKYNDFSELDTELFHIKAIGSYQSSRLDLNGLVSFDENQTTTGDANVEKNLIESDTTRAELEGEYRLSPKFSFGAGIHYEDREYTNDGEYFEDNFADRESYTLPFDVYYELTPKVDLSVGYRYKKTEVDSTNVVFGEGSPFSTYTDSYDTESHFFNVGARGQLLPKLTGFFKIGYTFRDPDDATVQDLLFGSPFGPSRSTNHDDNGTLGLDSSFTWSATPKLTAKFDLGRDFGVGGEGDATENTSFDTSLSYAISPFWSAQSNFGYTLREYDNGREDDQFLVGARGAYSPNQYWSFSAGYTFSKNDSDADDRSYDSHMLDLTASLRY